MVALSCRSLLSREMTSVMAFAWALEPSALSDPSGQPRPEEEDEPPELLLAGAAVPAGSEPQAAKLSVPTASTAASLEIRDSWFGFADVWSVVMRVLTERRGWTPGGPGGTTPPGERGRADPPDGWNVRKRVVR